MKRERIEVERAAGVTSWGLSQMVAQLVGLPRAKKAVLRVLADHYPNIWPKIETIADQAGYSPSRTRAVMRDLETEGFIRCLTDTRGGVSRPAQYAINVAKIKAMLEEQTQQPVLPLDNAEINPTQVGANPTLLEHEPTNGRRVNPPMVGANPPMVGAEHTKNREFQHTSEQRRQQRSAHAPHHSVEDAAMAKPATYSCFVEFPKGRVSFHGDEAQALMNDGYLLPPTSMSVLEFGTFGKGRCEVAEGYDFDDFANWFAVRDAWIDAIAPPEVEWPIVLLPFRDRLEFNPGMGLPDPPLVEEFA